MSRRSVLLTCAGQRVDIASAFRDALDRLGFDGEVVCVDAHPLSPTLFTADAGQVAPRIAAPAYIPALLELVERHGVFAVLPLTDLDNIELGAARDAFAAAGATLFLPEEPINSSLFDKHAAHRLLVDHGIGSPATWLPEDLPAEPPLPLLVKQRWGYGSRNIHRCESVEEVGFFVRHAREPVIVQRLCQGEEFSIDVLCDLDGRALNAIPRTMIESKGGESIKGMTIADERLIEQGRLVAERLRLRGPGTVQCFDEGGELLVTDVNPRFGGAFPLPLAAGSCYPELVLRLADGQRVEPRLGRFRAGVVMTRFLDAVVLDEAAADVRELSRPSAATSEADR